MPETRPLRALIVTSMRDEGPFILEWLAHHKAIGFTDFLVYSNDCEDGTDAMLDRLAEMGELAHVRNSPKGNKTVQWQALSAAAKHPLLKQVDWIYGTDVDEFLTINVGEGRLADLFSARPEATGFTLAWRMFGNNGIAKFRDAPVTKQFTKCAPVGLLWPWRAVQFKSLYRNDGTYRKLGVHRPRDPRKGKESRALWLDGAGDPLATKVPGSATLIPGVKNQYVLAQINHYAIGSAENFLVKRMRGKPNHTSEPIDLAYWIDRNFNAVEDNSIARVAPLSEPVLADFMADPFLREMHKHSIFWRRQQIARLIRDPEAFYLFARALQAGSSEVLPLNIQSLLFDGLVQMRQGVMRRKAYEAEHPGTT